MVRSYKHSTLTSPVLHVCFQGDRRGWVDEEASNQGPVQNLFIVLAPQPLQELPNWAEPAVTHL